MKKSTRLVTFVFLDLLIVIAAVWFLLNHTHFLAPNNPPAPKLTQKPSITQLSLGAGEQVGDYTMYSLPGDLSQANINDIVFATGAMWVGTEKGLLKINGDRVTVYKQFSDWPFEWIKNVVVTPYRIAVNTLVAQHNYGGHYAGSYLFDIQKETWSRLGGNVMTQTWLDGYLYQASTKLLQRISLASGQKQDVLHGVCKYGVSSLVMRAINGEIWLAGDTLRQSNPGCGVTRYNPKTGKSVVYKTQDGVNDNTGVDIGGDSAAVFVASSYSGHLSRFDQNTQVWRSLYDGGTGTHICVTPQAIWLGTLNPAHPLIRIDRSSHETTSLPAVSEKERISALGIHDREIWFGTYVTNRLGQSFTIQSRLGRYIERR